MATRFWLTSSAPPYTPATRRGSWAVAAGEDIQYLGRKPAGAAGSSTINVGSTAANRDVLLHRSISDGAIKAGTLSGTVQWVIGAKESNANLNAFFHLHIYVTSGDSDTPRGTLLTDSIGATEFGTTAVGATEGAKTLTPVSVQVGDRIVVEIGYRASSAATTYNATINYGNTGTTDLTNGSASVTSQPGWVEFSGADGLWTKSFSTLTDQFPTTIDSKWTASAGVSVVSGRARINCTTATPNLYTATPYQIQSSTAAFQAPTLPTTGGGSTVNFSAYLMPGPTVSTTNLAFEYSPNTGNLLLKNNVGGADATPTTLAYSAVDHLWWRFREAAGSIYMETSPDNVTWTTRRTISTMSQWMLQGNHILYFDATRASGTADYAEIDNINPPSGLSATVGIASETGTVQALGRAKTRAVTTGSSTETAQPVGQVKRLALGAAVENASGQAVGRAKTRALGQAAETDTARPLGKVLALHQAAETGTALPIGRAKRIALGQATETGTGQALTAAKTRSVLPASAVDGAQPLAAYHRAQATTATSTETARPLAAAKTSPLAPAGQSSDAQPLHVVKHTPATASATVETSQPLTVTRTYPLTPAAATDTAQTVPARKTLALGATGEEDAAGMLTTGLARAVDHAASTDTALPLHVTKRTSLTPAQTADAAQPTSAAHQHTAAPAAGIDSARPLGRRKTIALGPAFDYTAAQPATATKTVRLAPAVDYATAQPLAHGAGQALNPANGIDGAQPLRVTKTRLLGPALCTDTATSLTTPDTGTAHGIRLTGRPHTAWAADTTTTPWAAAATRTAWTADPAATAWSCRTRTGGDVNSLSTEYHEVPVAWTRGDPTAHTVEMAVIPVGHDPADTDWHPATWDTNAEGLTVAKLLVGPDGGAVAPTPGMYRDWVAVDAPPEHPVLYTPPFEIS